ncbi:Y4yA family PLP-dependent enzyme [Nocardia seriolae]|uniref:Diaminopimelate decarboxylase n=1 Tax=Nocardia seriolae TaxID=37332 RepID=A0ABC8AP36_9NOCA|nr:Y4yA family PLP-dependent enzyme [Nocardia seriolae]APA95757.1 Diaminopimelate decarboxylase [Nocardia seriolae]WKY53485.1 Y4yA family PLP-dependent enzyme [Nocardia seriolae]WNJ60220.1 Y4yA family PLP-dependent enzyme [Nocardia seriolae]BAW09861.1 diaminopimelate epimerase [Nocardia seriolae]BEK85232.1 Y4yA family PLP-dependent enzyme [Nocardia seriolae]
MKPLTVPPGISDITATPMPAHRDSWEQQLLDDPDLLRTLSRRIDRPFHIMYPARVVHNIDAFQQVFRQTGVMGDIYYGKKANKSPSVVRACAKTGVGVDVSSPQEFRAALRGGIRGIDLMVTGPAKSDELLRMSATYGALVAIDDLDELARLTDLGIPTRVVLRVLPPDSPSRFGMTQVELDLALTLTDPSAIRLEGFSFHLQGYEIPPRARLAAELIELCHKARTLGHEYVGTISIGGGFGVDYVPAEAWHAFLDGVNPHWFHGDRAPQPGSYYPYHCPVPGPAMLAAVLDHDQLGRRLRTSGIRLAIEPGRALLDRAGCTVFRVQGVKVRLAHEIPYVILTVDGTSLSLSEQWFDSEYLPDPALWPQYPGAVTPTCVGGSSCLEDDMLSWRRIPLPRAAQTDDLLIYPNTAGYQMDSNESAFHQLPIPPKVLLKRSSDGSRSFDWELEDPGPLD